VAEVGARYSAAELGVLSEAEARRYGTGDPRADITLAWELLYRLEPELYERLVAAERLHPDVLAWFPDALGRVVEVGAGTGRLTVELVGRAREYVAVEPAAPLREILARRVAARVVDGFFDDLPFEDGYADLVVACSALTPAPGHGGDAGLAEMERVCRPGGQVVIVWPNHIPWLEAHGYEYVSFAGEMCVEFASAGEAAELTAIFYPRGAAEVRRRGLRRVPYDVLGVNPPRDLAYKVVG
jgi:SAM-dependent methyltransferase